MTGRLRITGGELVRRLIDVPPAANRGELRPTADKVRQALFATLQSRLARDGRSFDGLVVVDLCCGSGALGFEALSRGASLCTFVDHNRRTIDVVAASAVALGVSDRATMVAAPVTRALDGRGPFDVVFFDPPYAMELDAQLRHLLATTTAPAGLLVVERSARGVDPPIEGLSLVDDRRYGDTRLLVYQRDAQELA